MHATLVLTLALTACGSDPWATELDWQIGPDEVFDTIFTAPNGKACAAITAVYSLDGQKLRGGSVSCEASGSTWAPLVPEHGDTLAFFPSLTGHWVIQDAQGAQMITKAGLVSVAPPATGQLAYTDTGAQLVRSGAGIARQEQGGTTTTLIADARGATPYPGVGDDVFLLGTGGELSVIRDGAAKVLVPSDQGMNQPIGVTRDGTYYGYVGKLDDFHFVRIAKDMVTTIAEPPFPIDHRHGERCGLTPRGTMFCMMYFSEFLPENSDEGWLGHYELVRLDGTSWERIGLGPPGSSFVNTAFLVATSDAGRVYAADTFQHLTIYGYAY